MNMNPPLSPLAKCAAVARCAAAAAAPALLLLAMVAAPPVDAQQPGSGAANAPPPPTQIAAPTPAAAAPRDAPSTDATGATPRDSSQPGSAQPAPQTGSPQQSATATAPAKAPPQTPPKTLQTLVCMPYDDWARLRPADSAAISILGKKVFGREGEDMGRVVDVLADRDGRVRAAVIDFGGFLGVGNHRVAVDWQTLQVDPDNLDKPLVLNLSPDQVRRAPAFKDAERPPPAIAPAPAQPAPPAAPTPTPPAPAPAP